MLLLIQQALANLKVDMVKITGDVAAADRDRSIRRFNEHPECRVFLSSDAGAYGVDLHRGSHLICYDLPWSAGVLQQRISRIDRTSSAFSSINIFYLYGAGTIEERMLHQLQQKMAVAGAFLDGKYDLKSGSLPLDFQSLREFLLQ
jgi:SNF2 family DNA or RNA helicase